jgi:hypothetical protein
VSTFSGGRSACCDRIRDPIERDRCCYDLSDKGR